MRWFSVTFDLLAVIVVAVAIILFVKYKPSFENNVVLDDTIMENVSDKEEKPTTKPMEDNVNVPDINYINEALVETTAPKFDGIPMSSGGSNPEILIYHTHTSELYEGDMGSVVEIGSLLAELLTEKGYNVLHDTTINDGVYEKSYDTAYINVREILKKNPGIKCIIDVHRDSPTENMVVTENGIPYAKLMMVVGTDVRLENNNWRYNLSFAQAIQINCIESIDGIVKPIYLSKNRYNQHLCDYSVIVEVGGLGNTIFEAFNSTHVLAEAIDKSLRGY